MLPPWDWPGAGRQEPCSLPGPASFPLLCPHCSTHHSILGDKAGPIFGEEAEAGVQDASVFSVAVAQPSDPEEAAARRDDHGLTFVSLPSNGSLRPGSAQTQIMPPRGAKRAFSPE